MTELEYFTFIKKASPTKFHNYFAEFFRASNELNVDIEGFETYFLKYLSTRKKGEDFNPSMQSWHKYLIDVGLDNRPIEIMR